MAKYIYYKKPYTEVEKLAKKAKMTLKDYVKSLPSADVKNFETRKAFFQSFTSKRKAAWKGDEATSMIFVDGVKPYALSTKDFLEEYRIAIQHRGRKPRKQGGSNKIVTFRMSKEEYDALDQQASAKQLKVSDYIRNLIEADLNK
ncbi:hypothetical protein KMW28_28175 [Flammeovirga yaeyamensis]|uniref:Ribbon-helix-helix protein CopG domain-containing protein n=1 Tax=Flammeovirga yaeyamensis TaxID=367791 RepID=A0AAX1NCV4_9BACT|nr:MULTISPECIES: hypothetical protein [Flammeovirga]ANQ52485.1 hypothetical protein MY04_5153 [Flammeovirga sp. MY04]MBB3697308.1 hypothetical protein [Flammeovirga yaeyamensis]NMF33964.1 hypothetical protein [Flammeovirga yaeyamensis]QWG04776.1 hypothetical protein KMW28_28175 [Flammeovirga yaeyamensis]